MEEWRTYHKLSSGEAGRRRSKKNIQARPWRGTFRKLSSGKARTLRSKTNIQVILWRELTSWRPIYPESCGAFALALVWVSLPLCSRGLGERRDMDDGQIDTRAML